MNKINKIKKILAFTLAELLLTLAIIGVVAAVVLPAIKNLTPNTEKAMFLKAYGVFTRTVHDMLSNEDLYPEDGDKNGTKHYFANTDKATYRGVEYSGSTKFCELFAAHLNVKEDVNCTEGVYNFETTDGIAWFLPVDNFSSSTSKLVKFDVNGRAKGPNMDEEDVFRLYLTPNGGITFFEANSIEEKYINESDLSLSKSEH